MDEGCREGNRPLGRPWRRWEDDAKMDLEVGCKGPVACPCEYINRPAVSVKGWELLD